MRSLTALLPLLTAAVPSPVEAPAPVKTIDLNEAGRVLATLDDWRGIMFAQLTVIGVLILLIVALIGVIVWLAGKRSANDQATLDAVLGSAKASTELAAAVRALEMIAARRESERLP